MDSTCYIIEERICFIIQTFMNIFSSIFYYNLYLLDPANRFNIRYLMIMQMHG